jgi:glycerol-3-phosphate dehydrogenase (NAD(P)+)
MTSRILIIGAGGRIGRAFQHIFSAGDGVTTIDLCDSDTAACPVQRPLEETVPHADIIVLCVYSWVMREVLEKIVPLVRPGAIIISLAKGIEKDSRKTMDMVLNEVVGTTCAWGVVSGPMLAEEIMQNGGSAGVIASTNPQVFKILVAHIRPADVLLLPSTDVRGVAVAGVLKNVYALVLGIADGLNWGANRKGWLIAAAAREMEILMERLGGTAETVEGPAVIGDLVACAFSPLSRNRATGETLVKTGELNPKSEGAVSLDSLVALLGDTHEEFVLLASVKKIVIEHEPAAAVFETLLQHAHTI